MGRPDFKSGEGRETALGGFDSCLLRQLGFWSIRSRREIGWEPRVTFEEGMRQTVAWRSERLACGRQRRDAGYVV